MKTLFTDVTGTVPDAEEIARKAELFRQQTGIALFIVILPDIGNDSNLLIVFYVQIMPDDFVMQLH
ncbi:putative transport system permease protein, partial [Escherichia coli 3006]